MDIFYVCGYWNKFNNKFEFFQLNAKRVKHKNRKINTSLVVHNIPRCKTKPFCNTNRVDIGFSLVSFTHDEGINRYRCFLL